MKSKTCLLMIVASVSISGCVKASECAWSDFIYPTPADAAAMSDTLADQIIVHNETRQANCPS